MTRIQQRVQRLALALFVGLLAAFLGLAAPTVSFAEGRSSTDYFLYEVEPYRCQCGW